MRINISIPKEDLELIDQYCFSTGMKRSTFLTRSALKEIGVHKKDIDYGYPSEETKRLYKLDRVEALKK